MSTGFWEAVYPGKSRWSTFVGVGAIVTVMGLLVIWVSAELLPGRPPIPGLFYKGVMVALLGMAAIAWGVYLHARATAATAVPRKP